MICQWDDQTTTVSKPFTCCNAQPGDEVVDDGPDGRLPHEIGRERSINGDGGSDGQKGRIDPVEFLPPIMEANRRQFLGILQRVLDVIWRHAIVGNFFKR